MKQPKTAPNEAIRGRPGCVVPSEHVPRVVAAAIEIWTGPPRRVAGRASATENLI